MPRRQRPVTSCFIRSSRSTHRTDYPNYYDPGKPIFRGIFENNDPTKRLMAIINYNTDISEFWEFSGTGLEADRGIERRVQARRQLHHLRDDALGSSEVSEGQKCRSESA